MALSGTGTDPRKVSSHQKSLLTVSLGFQIFAHYHQYFIVCWYTYTILSYVAKTVWLIYPTKIFGWEIAILVFFFFIDTMRLWLGLKGNKTQRRSMLGLCLIMGIPVLYGNVFFMYYQTYIFLMDRLMCGVTLCIVSIESFLGLMSLAALNQLHSRYPNPISKGARGQQPRLAVNRAAANPSSSSSAPPSSSGSGVPLSAPASEPEPSHEKQN